MSASHDISLGELDFLLRIQRGDKLPLADRHQDKIRQRLRRRGYVEVLMDPRRWCLTAKGTDALESLSIAERP